MRILNSSCSCWRMAASGVGKKGQGLDQMGHSEQMSLSRSDGVRTLTLLSDTRSHQHATLGTCTLCCTSACVCPDAR